MPRRPQRPQSFAKLLEYHIQNGTRPAGRPSRAREEGLPWSLKQLAAESHTTERSLHMWRSGRHLPQFLHPIENALFGNDPALAAAREELRAAYVRDGQSAKKQNKQRVQRTPSRLLGRANGGIAKYQTYFVQTPCNNFSIYSLSIVLGSDHNILRTIDDLLELPQHQDIPFTKAENLDAFFAHVIGPDLESGVLESILYAIDHRSAIVYHGSIHPVTTGQLARLPVLIKSFAGLSSRQFRVGLFRLSTTIIIITASGTVAAYGGIEVARALSSLGTHVIERLSTHHQ